MILLGIDPGTATTGFAIIKHENRESQLLEYGCILTEKTDKRANRLLQISNDIQEIIKKWKPDHAAIEKLFFNKNIKTAIKVAEARGVISMEIERANIPQEEYTPLEIKTAVCGNGKADKAMVQKMVQLIYKLKEIPKPDDAADAIAIAFCLESKLKNI